MSANRLIKNSELSVHEELGQLIGYQLNILVAFEELTHDALTKEEDNKTLSSLTEIEKDTAQLITEIHQSRKVKDNSQRFGETISTVRSKIQIKWGETLEKGIIGNLQLAFLNALDAISLIEIAKNKINLSMAESFAKKDFFAELKTHGNKLTEILNQGDTTVEMAVNKARSRFISKRNFDYKSEIDRLVSNVDEFKQKLKVPVPNIVASNPLINEKVNAIRELSNELDKLKHQLFQKYGDVITTWPLDILQFFQEEISNFIKKVNNYKGEVAHHDLDENFKKLIQSAKEINTFFVPNKNKEKEFIEDEIRAVVNLVEDNLSSFGKDTKKIIEKIKTTIDAAIAERQNQLEQMAEFLQKLHFTFIEYISNADKYIGEDNKNSIKYYAKFKEITREATQKITIIHSKLLPQFEAGISTLQNKFQQLTTQESKRIEEAREIFKKNKNTIISSNLQLLDETKPSEVAKERCHKAGQSIATLQQNLADSIANFNLAYEPLDKWKKNDLFKTVSDAVKTAQQNVMDLKRERSNIERTIASMKPSLTTCIVNNPFALPSEVFLAKDFLVLLDGYVKALPNESEFNSYPQNKINELLVELENLQKDNHGSSHSLKKFKDEIGQIGQFLRNKMLEFGKRQQEVENNQNQILDLRKKDILKIPVDRLQIESNEFKLLYLEAKCEQLISSLEANNNEHVQKQLHILKSIKDKLNAKFSNISETEQVKRKLIILSDEIEQGHEILAKDNSTIILIKDAAKLLQLPVLKQYIDLATAENKSATVAILGSVTSILMSSVNYGASFFSYGAKATQQVTAIEKAEEIKPLEDNDKEKNEDKNEKIEEPVANTQEGLVVETQNHKPIEEITESSIIENHSKEDEVKQENIPSQPPSTSYFSWGNWNLFRTLTVKEKQDIVDKAVKVCNLVMSFVGFDRADEIGIQVQNQKTVIELYNNYCLRLQNEYPNEDHSLDERVKRAQDLEKDLTTIIYEKLSRADSIQKYDEMYKLKK